MSAVRSEPFRIQRLLPRHYKILELAIAGHSQVEIAQILELSSNGVGMVMRSPIFQGELARRREKSMDGVIELDRRAFLGQARSIMEQSAVRAAEIHHELLEDEDSAIRLRSAEQILDRVFGAAKADGPVVNVTIHTDDVKLLVQALHESGQESHDVVTANSPTAHPEKGEQGDVCLPAECPPEDR